MRPGLPEDADELEQLEIELFPHNCLNALSLRNELRFSECWVVDADEKIVAYVLLRRDGDLVDILRLGVSVPYRRKGLAQQLLSRALEECTTAMLMVEKDNDPAIRLYKRAGFEVVAEVNSSWVLARAAAERTELRRPCTA